VLLYIERWLKAPVQMEDGSVVPRTAGAPQGGGISPLLANLFLHYAFDTWMARHHPRVPFERYPDDAICHCKNAEDAQALWNALADRFAACRLVLHPEKTGIVYCKDANRCGDFPNQSFDFLGFSFRARKALGRERRPVACLLPAVSPKALEAISRTIRRWTIHHHRDKSLQGGWHNKSSRHSRGTGADLFGARQRSSLWAERLIGTLRRDCLDHVLILGEEHLRRVLTVYSRYYNEARTHLGLCKDAPLRRAVERSGKIVTPQSCLGCTIAATGYDFREGQGLGVWFEREAKIAWAWAERRLRRPNAAC
jgi:hypothetical protein